MPSAAELRQALTDGLAALTRGPVASAVQSTDDAGGLLAEEEALVANAIQRRRNEFAAGRRSARSALAKVGCPALPLMIGTLRQPLWPEGFAGSITHDGRYAAAIAWKAHSGSPNLSLDLIDRDDFSVFPSVAPIIVHPDEPRWDGETALARMFSAKETAIKILSPRLGRWMDLRALRAREAEGGYVVVLPGEQTAIRVRTLQLGRVILSLGMALETHANVM
jgi:4'-phosphopantetheinyl transferase EntD